MPQRRPRIQTAGYLAWIRDLPCAICGTSMNIEAAHIRFADFSSGKPITGVGTKPDDCWTLPLCVTHHAQQHRDGERLWWANHDIDPIRLAALLWLNFTHDNRDAALKVLEYVRPYVRSRR